METANDAFAQLGIEKGNAGFVEEVRHRFPYALAVGTRAQEQQGACGFFDHFYRIVNGAFIGIAAQAGADIKDRCGVFINWFFGNIFRQFQMYGTGTLFLCQAKCLPHHRGDHIYVDNLSGVFCEGFHHAHDIDDLKLALFALFDGLLARDHEQGHAA